MPATLQAEAARDCEAQLAQVRARIVDATAAAKRAETMSLATYRICHQRLHTLYVLEYDIRQDLAKCAS